MSRRKVWKLHQQNVKEGYSSYINKCRERTQKYASVLGHWNVLKGTLVEVTDQSCGLIKSPVRQRETWQWNDVNNSVSEKRKLRRNENKETQIRRSI